MVKETGLLEQKELREKAISRIEVLDKVGDLLLLPNTEYGTVEQIANYYKVGKEAIQKIIQRHKDELIQDGYKNHRKSEIENIYKQNGHYVQDVESIENTQTKTIIKFQNKDILSFGNAGMSLFPKRAILRVGMLLRDSEVAKEIRTRLLDIIQDTEKESPKIIQNVVAEISEEKQLMLDRVEAEIRGDYSEVSVINAKLFQLKNKRIEELENINNTITTHALTIMESRDVINRLARNIAMKEYNSMFGKAYGDLYSKVNYKLGINIKLRNKKKNESYLHTLTEEETYEVEKIVRNWAIKIGLDVDKLLKIV